MSQKGVTTGRGRAVKSGTTSRVLKCVLTPNREDRPRYVELVAYEVPEWGDGPLTPVRRMWQWVAYPDGTRWVCVRVTVLRWRQIQPGQAHVEMRDAWMAHVREQKTRTRGVKGVEADHLSGVTGGGV